MVELSGTTETRVETNAGISDYTGNATNQDTEGSEKDKYGLHSCIPAFLATTAFLHRIPR